MSSGIKQVFVTGITEFSTEDKEGIGTVRYTEDGNVYKWVQNGEASTITATLNGAACYETTVRDVANIPLTANLANLAGYWRSACPGQSYGWIQAEGSGSVVLAAQSATKAAFGVALIPANTVETMTSSAAVTLLYGEVAPTAAIAIVTTTTTVNAVFKCRL